MMQLREEVCDMRRNHKAVLKNNVFKKIELCDSERVVCPVRENRDNLNMKGDQRRAVMKDDSEKEITEDVEVFSVAENNSAIFIRDQYSPVVDYIPVESLLVLKCKSNGKSARALKDDGCNTNVVSRSFAAKNRDKLKSVHRNVIIKHSNKHTTEKSSETI